jgi:hypothetical protein
LTFEASTLRDLIETRRDEISETEGWIDEGIVESDDVDILSNLALQHRLLARYEALRGESTHCATSYAAAARYYLEHIREIRAQRSELDDDYFLDEPAMAINAIDCSLISGDSEVITDATDLALSMDDDYLKTFTEDQARSTYRFYSPQLEASIVRDTDSVAEFLDVLEDIDPELSDSHQKLSIDIYRQIVAENETELANALERFLKFHESTIDTEDPDPSHYVADEVAGKCIAARKIGLSVNPNSPYLPEALLERSHEI